MTESQPDDEPGAAVSNPSPSGNYHINESPLEPERDRAQGEIAQNTPIPGDADEDDLVCKGLHCEDLEPESFELELNMMYKNGKEKAILLSVRSLLLPQNDKDQK